MCLFINTSSSVPPLDFKQLVPLSVVAAECVAAFAVDAILQMHFLQAGALWHLLLAMFQYDYTLQESGVAAKESSSLQVCPNVFVIFLSALSSSSPLCLLSFGFRPLPTNLLSLASMLARSWLGFAIPTLPLKQKRLWKAEILRPPRETLKPAVTLKTLL